MTTAYEDKAGLIKDKVKDKRESKERKPKVPKKITERYLYNSGLAYLQRFPASSSHFRSVMMRKIQKSCYHHKEQSVEEGEKFLDDLILKFQELSLLDDTAYLKGMVTSLRRRGLSSLQISMKLRQKGYSGESVKKELEEYDEEEYQLSKNGEENGDIYTALIFARKKRLGPYDIEKKKEPKKSLAIMARAGYSFDVAKKTLNLSLEELEENY